MKKFLKALLERRQAELAKVQRRFEESEDITEVRALGETLSAIKTEIEDIEKQLKDADDGDNGDGGNGGEGARGDNGEGANARGAVVNGSIIASYGQNAQARNANVNVLDSIEYRNAFADYVRTGNTTAFEALEARAASDGMIITSDIGKIIPNTIMNEVIKKLKVYGNLYSKVRKLNVKGGVEFPIEELVPTVKWISETTVSDPQKTPEIKTSVQFGYHICEARIAQSLLSQIVSLEYLESEISTLLTEAFVKEFDNIILNGSGAGQPLGILNDSRVPGENKITFSESDMGDWTKFRKKLFAKIPLAYRAEGIIITTVPTWESYFMTLKDSNQRPLYSETFDVADGATVCRFNGREVVLVESDILKDFDTATTGEAFAVYLKPTNYAINSNLQLGFKRYFNEDTNKWVNKGLCIMDGKLLDTNGVFILTK